MQIDPHSFRSKKEPVPQPRSQLRYFWTLIVSLSSTSQGKEKEEIPRLMTIFSKQEVFRENGHQLALQLINVGINTLQFSAFLNQLSHRDRATKSKL